MTLTVPDFSTVNVLVVGDLMLDQYWFGPTSRISPEAPVPVVRVTGSQTRAGGAANVGINLARLGVETTCVGVVGNDANADELAELLGAENVRFDAVQSRRRPTITKLRVLSRNQQLIRLDTEDHYTEEDLGPLEPLLADRVPDAGACVVSDYAKGTLARAPSIIALCREHQVPVLVDPKGTDFARYSGATLMTPNRAEFEAVVGPFATDDELIAKATRLRQELRLDALVVTLGERGMVLVPAGDEPVFLPARAREVFDVTGAGDTVIATLAAGIAAGIGLADAAALANLAAGLVVRKIGVASVTPSELRLALHETGRGGRSLLTRAEVAQIAAETRARGERLVMTNGCFDILHTGHVAYLEEAKARGDRLLVAVNDDDSVTRLKGAGRPINPLEDRMAVLAGLASVDWVVPFSEDTPEALVGEVLPDVLVKGGDYRPEDIAGGRIVLENGGTVEVLSFREGRSTSAIIEALRRQS
ncbi:MAG: bifunctional D-glycero-beta-D-manno-heptose-7-phosphate kinase/D-glycero-beta-D-manno-heptose 1-phosphate adenylyltransferase HldE [Gammaproteobacteria bacterium]|nr:bifunctional D-glycero-beta-D-manno-heptose-7-phosphate kinase/D-glycero-beta-D-manno-heptose 1-phosphate adenylyltransferase HldE [Gammaproteobacteria bacterium]